MAISKSDETAIRHGVRHVLERQQRAFDNFAATLAQFAPGIDHAKTAAFMVRKKLAKFDGGTDYRVVHGGLLDRGVLERINAEATKCST